MFQQRQLSNRATSSADLLNDTSQLLQRNLTNRATQPIESRNASCRLKISPDNLFPFWKNFTKRRRRRSHARFVVRLLILLVLLILLIYKERGLIINELRGVKLNGSSTVLSRLFNERFISNEETTPWRPFFYGKKRGQTAWNLSLKKHLNERRENGVPLSQACLYLYNKVMSFCKTRFVLSISLLKQKLISSPKMIM